MEQDMAYFCDGCEKVINLTGERAVAPECCGKEMSLLPINECIKDPSSAEHARSDDEDAPCDPGLGG